MDPHYVNSERPAKRTRQACETCRRKKSKCNGERPSCSLCTRLRQQCDYVDLQPESSVGYVDDNAPPQPVAASRSRGSDHELHNRIESLESALAEVLQTLKTTDRPSRTSPRSPHPWNDAWSRDDAAIVQPDPAPSEREPASSSQPLSAALPPEEIILALADDYLKFCHCQPLPLFHRDDFRATFQARDPEVVYSVLALVARFSDSAWVRRNVARDCARYCQVAHQMVLTRVMEGRVELSTIQTLCLLALVEFHDGDSAKSLVQSSLAMTLARSARLHQESRGFVVTPFNDERRRCYWSIVLLRRLLGEPLYPSYSRSLPAFPDSSGAPPCDALSPEGLRMASRPEHEDTGIVAVVIQLSEVWAVIQDYARARGLSDGNVAPWSPFSRYSTAQQMLMNLGHNLSPLHRYRCLQLSSVTAEDLESSRGYWAPWLLSRFLYHTAICILNHPLLITLQLQGVPEVPELFLQQTAFSVSHHTSWMLHLIDLVVSRRFRVSDPIMGHCVAIIATIELQQSFSEGGEVAQKRKSNFAACLNFLQPLASDWPSISQLVIKIKALENQLSHSRTTVDGDSGVDDETLTIDISGFMQVLDIADSTRARGQGNRSTMFGPSLFRSSEASSAQPPGPTQLARLPQITAMEPTSAQPGASLRNSSGMPGNNTRGGVLDMQPNISGSITDDLMLPAVQFFNAGQLQAGEEWWDSTFALSTGHFTPSGAFRPA